MKKENRGGARPGSGPKPQYQLSEKEVKLLVKAMRKKAKETGMHISDKLADLIYQDADKRTALAAMKLYYDKVIVSVSEKDVNIKQTTAPAIGLPPKQKDPALKVMQGGKKD